MTPYATDPWPAREGRSRDRLLIIGVLISLPLVAFPRLGPLKAIDIALLVLTVRALGSNRRVVPRELFGIVAIVVSWTVIAIGLGRLGGLHQLGDWSVGLESPHGYPFVAAFRMCTAALGSYEFIRLCCRERAWAAVAATRTLLVVSMATVALWLAGPGRDLEGRPRGTFTERGPLSRYLIVMVALVLFLRVRRRPPLAVFVAVGVAALTGALSGALLAGSFGGVFLAREVRRRLNFSSVAPAVVALAFLTALAPVAVPLLGEKVTSLRRAQREGSGGNGRYAALLIVGPVVRSAPLTGYGTGSYIFVRDSEEFGSTLARISHDNADVPLIETAVDFGLVGGTAFLGLILVAPFRRRNRGGGNWPWLALLGASLFTGTAVTYLLWLAFAMAMQHGDGDGGSHTRSHREPGSVPVQAGVAVIGPEPTLPRAGVPTRPSGG